MKFVIIGSGAIGTTFGAMLQQAGHDVIFVARGQRLQTLRERGITVVLEHETLHLPELHTVEQMATIGAVDYVLIAVKAWQVSDLAVQLQSLKGSNTRFLTLQNGVEAPEIVAHAVGAEHTLAGLVRGFFEMDDSGVVRHVGVRPALIFGEQSGKVSPRAEMLLDMLTSAGIYAELAQPVDVPLWEKFLLVTSLSGVGAVTRASIGTFRDFAPTYHLLQQVMHEIAAVAQAKGIGLAPDVVERTLAFVATFPQEATTSMQRDLLSGLPSELEAQVGAVTRLGKEAGIATPLNDYIYTSLILQEMQARTRII